MPADEPVIWIVDSDQWPRACLRAELIERGYDAVGYGELTEALRVLGRETQPRPRVIVLELKDQTFTRPELDALTESKIPIIALGGAIELADPLIQGIKWALVMPRPVSLGAIADAVDEIAAQRV